MFQQVKINKTKELIVINLKRPNGIVHLAFKYVQILSLNPYYQDLNFNGLHLIEAYPKHLSLKNLTGSLQFSPSTTQILPDCRSSSTQVIFRFF